MIKIGWAKAEKYEPRVEKTKPSENLIWNKKGFENRKSFSYLLSSNGSGFCSFNVQNGL